MNTDDIIVELNRHVRMCGLEFHLVNMEQRHGGGFSNIKATYSAMRAVCQDEYILRNERIGVQIVFDERELYHIRDVYDLREYLHRAWNSQKTSIEMKLSKDINYDVGPDDWYREVSTYGGWTGGAGSNVVKKEKAAKPKEEPPKPKEVISSPKRRLIL